MLITLRAVVPEDQLLVIHASLGHIEWPGTVEHIEATAGGLPLIVARARKTFYEMVKRWGMFPSPQQRQCTSDLKRGPIERGIRRYLKENPRYSGLVVNCMGLRAEESTVRSNARKWKFNERNCRTGREWWEWLPVHDMPVGDVFATIADAGQEPHWAYAASMTRLSCSFCIMASAGDLCTAAGLRPDLMAEYVALETRIGHTLMMPRKGHAPERLDRIVARAQGRPAEPLPHPSMPTS